MLANISSKIILAVIAILAVYTFAPLIKSLLDSIFIGGKKKKNMSRSEFDEMVDRKIQQFSGKATLDPMMGGGANSSVRDEIDSLHGLKLFKSDSEYKNFKELKKELQWGSGDNFHIIKEKLKRSHLEVSDADISNMAKSLLKKKYLLDLFKKGTGTLSAFIDCVVLNMILKKANGGDISTFKAYKMSINEIKTIISIVLNPKHGEAIIDDYLNDIEASKFDLPFISQKISNINILDREVNKTVSIFEPLIERDSQYFDKKFFKVKDDEKRVKSLYKKLVQLHHPDKWNHFDKSKAITDRLNFNFNNLRNAYEKALS